MITVIDHTNLAIHTLTIADGPENLSREAERYYFDSVVALLAIDERWTPATALTALNEHVGWIECMRTGAIVQDPAYVAEQIHVLDLYGVSDITSA